MSIQKKSLLSGLNATKKAIVASSTTSSQANPTVTPRVLGKFRARVAGPKMSRVVMSRTKA
jgi:hypothetical protein